MNRREFGGLSFAAVLGLALREWTPRTQEYLVATYLWSEKPLREEVVLYQGSQPIVGMVKAGELPDFFMPIRLNGERLRVEAHARVVMLCETVEEPEGGGGLRSIQDVIATMSRGVRRVWILGGP